MDRKLQIKLDKRIDEGTLRSLSSFDGYIDFCSNDYLGYTRISLPAEQINRFGSTGSRLISGTSEDALVTEEFLANFFDSKAALVYNSGYDANLGFFSSVPQKGDVVLYDEYIHASIRDGLRLSFAQSFSFKHNDLNDLKQKISNSTGTKYVVIESIYSMDGDIAPLKEIAEICSENNVYLIVDEAHACGVFGESGKGLVSYLGLENEVLARIVTFGKAYGAHGASVLCDKDLKDYLVNFSRSFIYTTALPPEAYQRIKAMVGHVGLQDRQKRLHEVIRYFRNKIQDFEINSDPQSPIQLIRIGDINTTKRVAEQFQQSKIAIKPIFSPTVPVGREGLRICLHSFNTFEEIDLLIEMLHCNLSIP